MDLEQRARVHGNLLEEEIGVISCKGEVPVVAQRTGHVQGSSSIQHGFPYPAALGLSLAALYVSHADVNMEARLT